MSYEGVPGYTLDQTIQQSLERLAESHGSIIDHQYSWPALYALVEDTKGEFDLDGSFICIVVLRPDGYNESAKNVQVQCWHVNFMTEFESPSYFDCPMRIILKATPLNRALSDHQLAQEWRNNVIQGVEGINYDPEWRYPMR